MAAAAVLELDDELEELLELDDEELELDDEELELDDEELELDDEELELDDEELDESIEIVDVNTKPLVDSSSDVSDMDAAVFELELELELTPGFVDDGPPLVVNPSVAAEVSTPEKQPDPSATQSRHTGVAERK